LWDAEELKAWNSKQNFEMLSATILLLHDNARPHSAAHTQGASPRLMWEQKSRNAEGHHSVASRQRSAWNSAAHT
jgi:hypothetical protein